MRKWKVILIFFAFAPLTNAQDDLPIPENFGDSTQIVLDSIVERRNGLLDVFEGNPGKAAVKGLLIPAGGQIYNKRWWKVPLALGIEAATIYNLMNSYSEYEFWDTEYVNVVINDLSPTTILTNPDLILKQRNQWRTNREMGWVIFAVGHIFTAFEAYIDRHLLEFDVSDDLTFSPILSPIGITPSFSYSFDLTTNKYKTNPPILVIP